MSRRIHTEIDIDAAPEAVWSVLVDLDRYADWNPFVVSASGRVAIGERLVNRLQPPGGRAMTIKPSVTAVDTARLFEWLGHLGFRGLFDGRHRFELEPLPGGGTRFLHTEEFSGLLAGLLLLFIRDDTTAGFEAMNDALRGRAEAFV